MKPWSERGAARAAFEASAEERRVADARILINLVGPPGAGKSTLAQAFVAANPGWAFLSIDTYMVRGQLEHADAWEAMITHSRLYPNVIVESSGLSKHLRRLLKYRNHATVIVRASNAKHRRDTRDKPVNPGARRFGSMDQLEQACQRLEEVYPTAEVLDASGPVQEVSGAFTAMLLRAAARARRGGDPTPTMPRRQQGNLPAADPRRQARKKVERALRSGALVRPDRCDHCGKVGKVEGHHDDHARPLEVMWLCRPCHRRRDRKLQGVRARRA